MTLAPEAVRTMFDRIAPVYDSMNRVMTAGLDLRWRRLAAASVVRPGDRVLDAACGTGDLALADLRAGAARGDRARLLGGDARARAAQVGGGRVGRGRPARAAVRGRIVRRRHDRLRRPQPRRRPRARPARAPPRPAPRRPARDPRDHDAARRRCGRSSPLVRPRRARSSGRPLPGGDAYTYLPGVGAALPRRRGARGAALRGRLHRRPLPPARRLDRRAAHGRRRGAERQ